MPISELGKPCYTQLSAGVAKTNASLPQPAPQEGGRIVLDVVMADLQERAEMGKAKYGIYLTTGNGRNALWDAYQEALDLAMYLRQALLEQEKPEVGNGTAVGFQPPMNTYDVWEKGASGHTHLTSTIAPNSEAA